VRPGGAGRTPHVRDAGLKQIERGDQFLKRRLPEHDLVGARDAAEFRKHAGEPFRVRYGVPQLRPVGAGRIRADDEHEPLHRRGLDPSASQYE
jgi:hypothetical protein